MIERAIFYTPKDATATQIFRSFEVNRDKFIAEMDKRGYDLVGHAIYYKDPLLSKTDPNETHWIIKGNFRPRGDLERVIFENVPTRVVEKLEQRFGGIITRL